MLHKQNLFTMVKKYHASLKNILDKYIEIDSSGYLEIGNQGIGREEREKLSAEKAY